MFTADMISIDRATVSVALAGNPNAGKSTLFNALTGSRQQVGNWPGKTVEKKTGELSHDGRRLMITDLPGAYSLSAYTQEEIIARDFLLTERPDVVMAVLDAANLERNLYLAVQLLEFETPTVIALNMMDVARRQGLDIDLHELSRALCSPVIPTVARNEEGLREVASAAIGAMSEPTRPFSLDYGPEIEAEIAALLVEIEHSPSVAGHYPARWLAVRLLEEDRDIISRLARLFGSMALVERAEESRARLFATLNEDVDLMIADRRYTWIHQLASRVLRSGREDQMSLSDRIDYFTTDRRLGIPIFMIIMWVVFKITTDVSAPWVDWIDGVLSGPISRWALAALGALGLEQSWVASLLVDGVIAGVGGVLAFVPVLLSLYFALAVMEDSGYMARGAFVMDRLMNRIGLHGRSFLPLMVGFGCSVPAIYATRTMTSRRDQILTGLLVPFMSCGARLPVYVLFAAIFFPGQATLIIMGLYLLGIVVAILVGLALQRTLLPATAAPGMVMELPPYRLPNARSIRNQMWLRTRAFLQHAASLILLSSMVIWLLMAIPTGGQGEFAATPIEDSVFARVSAAVVPILSPLGFGTWESGGALISGLVAKEVVVSTLSQTFGTEMEAAGIAGGSFLADLREIITSFMAAVVDTLRALPGIIGINLTGENNVAAPGLASAIHNSFHASSGGHAAAAGLAFMVFVLLYTPCMATIAAEKHELGTRWTLLSLFGQLTIAWLVAYAAFQIGVWWGG